jgi:predicted peroxiredoxin
VRLATRGYADNITFATHPPTGKILADFIADGGRVWACGACTGPRGITADDLIDGATIATTPGTPAVFPVLSVDDTD